jgi:GNAT superfamily N-acetyltransferase
MQPRPFDPKHDLPAVADLISRTRTAGGLSHPGGIQWWLRDSGTKDDFEAFVWPVGEALEGFALIDGSFVVTERSDSGPSELEQFDWLERHMRDAGRKSIEFHVPEGDPLRNVLESRGYAQSGIEHELMADTSAEPRVPVLPEGFRFASLSDVSDDAYVEGHIAAWSDTRPSRYSRAIHDAVRNTPTFRPDLVTIVLADNGTVASCCIGWMDQRSATLEIEPLGTHRDFRRLGLAHAVVKEVQHRAWANGAKHVMVWNNPDTNPKAFGLYTGANMSPNRTLIELSKTLHR